MKRMWSKNELKTIAQEQLSSGQLKNVKVFENIVDKDGHPRFIEGDIDTAEISGITWAYAKWSLSGSHLLIVLAGNVANGSVIANSTQVCLIKVPKWIYDKIYPVWANYYIESKSIAFTSNEWSAQAGSFVIAKSSTEGQLFIMKSGDLTLSANRGFRIAFDLLIDNE